MKHCEITDPAAPVRLKRCGFSLVELLIVIAVIAVLIAIITPSLGMARNTARTSACLSNVRQLNMAFQNYTTEFGSKVFNYDATYPNLWVTKLLPYGNIDNVRLCPEAMTPTPNGSIGTATTYWGPDPSFQGTAQTGSYGLNGYWYATQPQVWPFWTSTVPSTGIDNIPVFADCNWVDGWPAESDPVPADSTTPPITGPMMQRFYLNRHNGGINVAFLDGHADRVKLEQLWSLKWRPDWTAFGPPTDPAPTPNPSPSPPPPPPGHDHDHD
jgi:prepilin-type N-terminal cleavage/methylation domain-containing protein/prepilin-type processing-associated H-X9-DG protein